MWLIDVRQPRVQHQAQRWTAQQLAALLREMMVQLATIAALPPDTTFKTVCLWQETKVWVGTTQICLQSSILRLTTMMWRLPSTSQMVSLVGTQQMLVLLHSTSVVEGLFMLASPIPRIATAVLLQSVVLQQQPVQLTTPMIQSQPLRQ